MTKEATLVGGGGSTADGKCRWGGSAGGGKTFSDRVALGTSSAGPGNASGLDSELVDVDVDDDDDDDVEEDNEEVEVDVEELE